MTDGVLPRRLSSRSHKACGWIAAAQRRFDAAMMTVMPGDWMATGGD